MFLPQNGFLQDSVVQGLICHQLLQPGVLLLEGLQLFGHLRSHPAVLLTPAVVRLLSDPQPFADLRNLLSLTEFDIGSTQHRDNLVNSMTFLCQLKKSFPG